MILLIINRVFLGLPGYNFFSPLIIAYIISLLGLSYFTFIIILWASIFWWIGHKIIMRYTNLSLYTKYLLYYFLSILSFIILSYSYSQFDPDNFIINQYTLFWLIVIVSLMQKVYSISKWYNHSTRRIRIIRFVILWYISSGILTSKWLNNFFITYPFTIIILWLIAILISTYEWLQVKEMVRFRRLIWQRVVNKKKRV